MAELLLEFPDAVTDDSGVVYRAQACGAPMTDGLWEGWIEFVPLEGGTPIRTPRETTQPNRVDAVYWATGLSPVYLEGALTRALDAVAGSVPRTDALATPSGAAPRTRTKEARTPGARARPGGTRTRARATASPRGPRARRHQASSAQSERLVDTAADIDFGPDGNGEARRGAAAFDAAAAEALFETPARPPDRSRPMRPTRPAVLDPYSVYE
jgi:hypothetical protein